MTAWGGAAGSIPRADRSSGRACSSSSETLGENPRQRGPVGISTTRYSSCAAARAANAGCPAMLPGAAKTFAVVVIGCADRRRRAPLHGVGAAGSRAEPALVLCTGRDHKDHQDGDQVAPMAAGERHLVSPHFGVHALRGAGAQRTRVKLSEEGTPPGNTITLARYPSPPRSAVAGTPGGPKQPSQGPRHWMTLRYDLVTAVLLLSTLLTSTISPGQAARTPAGWQLVDPWPSAEATMGIRGQHVTSPAAVPSRHATRPGPNQQRPLPRCTCHPAAARLPGRGPCRRWCCCTGLAACCRTRAHLRPPVRRHGRRGAGGRCVRRSPRSRHRLHRALARDHREHGHR